MSKTILVIEDDPALLGLIEDVVGMAGYKADLAADGPEGLAHLKVATPDLILLDLMLPSLDGLAVAQQVRADPVCREVPIVLMSGRSPTGAEVAISDAFLAKPFHLTELLQAIEHNIGA